MLCAPDSSTFAQDAEHDPPSRSTTQTSLIHDPYDPRIDTEYEILVQRWTHQLLERSREFISSLEDPAGATAATRAAFPAAPSAEDTTTTTDEHHQLVITMDRFFEELWLDAQHMLQCAQAWNYSSSQLSPSGNTDALSVKEAVRSMNIFGLRVLQRTLYARQTLLGAYHRQQQSSSTLADVPPSPLLAPRKSTSEPVTAVAKTTPCHDVPETPEKDDEKEAPKTEPHTSPDLPLTEEEEEDDEEEEGEHEMNAPLLRRKYHQSVARSCSRTTSSCCCDDQSRRSVNNVSQEAATTSNWVGQLPHPPVVAHRRRQLPPSIEEVTLPQLPSRSASTNRLVSSKRRNNQRQRSDILSMTSSSGMSSMYENGVWKSWFRNDDGDDNNNNNNGDDDKDHLCTSNTSSSSFCCDDSCRNHVPKKCLSTGDAEDSVLAAGAEKQRLPGDNDDDGTNNLSRVMTMIPSMPMDEKAEIESPIEELRRHRLHLSNNGNNNDDMTVIAPPFEASSLKMMRGYGFTNTMIRSESSISAFRPISKNLAPRCRRDSIIAEDCSSSSSSLPPPQPITKSKSFPSKVASMSSSPIHEPVFKTLPHRPDDNLGNKERNFVVRSIVNKKASLGKLFSGKK